MIRTLAEPNLTAISGETASFIAGGEFPTPNGLSCDTTCRRRSVSRRLLQEIWREPGVHTGRPAEGRISLKVMTEVSDLSTENAVTLQVPARPRP